MNLTPNSGVAANRLLVKRSVIYLVRHGESIGNVTRTFLHPSKDELSAMGKLQVDLLGKWLSREKVSRIYSSDYPRAMETARALLMHSCVKSSLEIQYDSRLRERMMGKFEGKSYAEALDALVASGKKLMEFEIPDGESLKDLSSRAEAFFRSLIQDLFESGSQDECILIVSHSFLLIKLLQFLTQSGTFTFSHWNYKQDFKLFQNASFVQLQVSKYADCTQLHIQFQILHETRHLEGIKDRDTLLRFSQSTEEAKKLVGCIQT